MFNIPEWPCNAPSWSEEALNLLEVGPPIQNVSFDDVIKKSDQFPIKFPLEAVRCKALKNKIPQEILERNINSTYTLLHETALLLYANFILHKRKYGTLSEKILYTKLNVNSLIERLLTKRAVMFMGRFDSYLLMDGTKGAGKWDTIGKDPKSKLSLEKYISYDEVKVSALLAVSSYTYFINDGTRKNFGELTSNRNNIEEEGIIVGLVGARLKKINFMEYQDLVISNTQNIESNGYSSSESLQSVFANFYEEPCFTYKDMLDLKKNNPFRFTEVAKEAYFDNNAYAKRIAISIDMLLFEANERAKGKNTTAFIHVVGLGLGVWKCSSHQEEVFVETFARRLQSLGKNLHSVSDVYFAYFNQTKSCGGYTHGQTFAIAEHPLHGIKIYIGKRNPHIKLRDQDEGKLLVVSYAWDGNALPGNEFWNGKLGSSGDSAAAASTQISEIHNAHINPNVSVNNLKIVTHSGLVSFQEYVSNLKEDKKRKQNYDDCRKEHVKSSKHN